MPNPRLCPLPDGLYPATDQYRAKDPTCCPQQRTNWTFQPNSRAANRVCWVLHWDVSLFLLSSCLSNGCSRTLVNILMQIYDVKSTSQESKAAAFADLFPQLLWMLLEHSLRMLDSFVSAQQNFIKSCLLPGLVPIQWLINVVTERSVTGTPIWNISERPFYTPSSPWNWPRPFLGLHCCSTSAQFSFGPVSSPGVSLRAPLNPCSARLTPSGNMLPMKHNLGQLAKPGFIF